MLNGKDQFDQMKQEQKERFQNQQSMQATGFGPPNFDNTGYDEGELEQAYEDFDGPADFPELEEEYPDEEEFGFTPPPQQEQPTPPSMRQEGAAFLREDAIFPGGPTRSEVASWKKQFEADGHFINLTDINGEIFIWRTMNRTEYREIMALPNVDPLQREEIICEVCTLFPYEYNFATMANRKAGTPAILAEQIMQESGFKKVAPPIRL